MPVLRIQHAVPSYEGWKRAFDSDPVGRKTGGVRAYRIYRSVAEPSLVMIDLEFDSLDVARAFEERLQRLWQGPARDAMRDPRTWILETMETGQVES